MARGFSTDSRRVNRGRTRQTEVNTREEAIDEVAKTNRAIRRNLEARWGAKAGRDSIVAVVYAIPPSRHSPVEYADGCRPVVTLALLIACPTKVYHYYCHPLFPASAPNSLVSPRLHFPILLSHLFSSLFSLSVPFPQPCLTLTYPADSRLPSFSTLSNSQLRRAFCSACKLSEPHSSGSRLFRLDSSPLSATFASHPISTSGFTFNPDRW